MTYTTNENITLLRSKVLTYVQEGFRPSTTSTADFVSRNWDNAETKLVFNPPMGFNYSTDLWAPELHQIDQKWYVIFTGDPNRDSPIPEVDMLCDFNCPAVRHRMFVLEGTGEDPWTASFTYKSQLNTFDQFAIDGTYFQHKTGIDVKCSSCEL